MGLKKFTLNCHVNFFLTRGVLFTFDLLKSADGQNVFNNTFFFKKTKQSKLILFWCLNLWTLNQFKATAKCFILFFLNGSLLFVPFSFLLK